jgi:hypothetical protein
MRRAWATTSTVVALSTLLVAGCAGAPTKGNTSPPIKEPVVTPPPTVVPPVVLPPEPPKIVKKEAPASVRGIHFSGWYAGSPDLAGPLLKWAKSAGINTLVLDVKAEDGKISWQSDIPLAKEIGANERKIADIDKAVKEYHDMGFWVVGRIVTMNDQFLYRGRPAWTIPGFPGGAYSFMDPKNENVWAYNIDIAKAAVTAGMDEIQFDYIRYPEKLVVGYNKETGPEYRAGNIDGFLRRAVDELHPLGVKVSADVFGLTTSVAEGDDMEIGQDYKKVAEIVDYVSAMVYPSHYARGTYGLTNPDNAPYETVKASMGKALERTASIPMEKHRPWIQDFTYPAAGAIHYGPEQVRVQVQALTELGIKSFLLWDASNKYSRGLDYAKLGE